MTEKNIRLHNRTIFYQVQGKGIPVILVHGFAEDHTVWTHQLHALAEQFLVIVPDLPGSGQSELVPDMSMERMAEVLHEIIVQEFPNGDFQKVIMVGHSMGGYITLAFAEQYPDRLLGFGLFHSGALPDDDEKKATRRRGIAFIQTHGSHEFIKQSAPNLFTEAYRIKNSIILAEMITRYSSFDPLALTVYYEAMIRRPDRTAVLQSFNKPILFIIGKEDKAIPFQDSMKQCHLPQLAHIEILENSAHMGMWEEKEKSTRALLSFLQFAAG